MENFLRERLESFFNSYKRDLQLLQELYTNRFEQLIKELNSYKNEGNE